MRELLLRDGQHVVPLPQRRPSWQLPRGGHFRQEGPMRYPGASRRARARRHIRIPPPNAAFRAQKVWKWMVNEAGLQGNRMKNWPVLFGGPQNLVKEMEEMRTHVSARIARAARAHMPDD